MDNTIVNRKDNETTTILSLRQMAEKMGAGYTTLGGWIKKGTIPGLPKDLGNFPSGKIRGKRSNGFDAKLARRAELFAYLRWWFLKDPSYHQDACNEEAANILRSIDSNGEEAAEVLQTIINSLEDIRDLFQEEYENLLAKQQDDTDE